MSIAQLALYQRPALLTTESSLCQNTSGTGLLAGTAGLGAAGAPTTEVAELTVDRTFVGVACSGISQNEALLATELRLFEDLTTAGLDTATA